MICLLYNIYGNFYKVVGMSGFKKTIILFGFIGNIYANSPYQTIIESGTTDEISIANSKFADQTESSVGDIMVSVSLNLLGQPYSRALLDRQTPEYMFVSLTNTDCMIFVEEILATSELIKQEQLTLDNLTRETKNLRYHGDLAYCNRNHYFKDWANANISKGYVIDEAYNLSGILFPYKANVMSSKIAKSIQSPHIDDLACIKSRENIINHEHLGFIPLKDLPRYLKFIQNGDIIGIVRTPNSREDAIHHLGIAYVHDDEVSMIHASSQSGEVVVAKSLTKYLSQYTDSLGIILLRPQLTNSQK